LFVEQLNSHVEVIDLDRITLVDTGSSSCVPFWNKGMLTPEEIEERGKEKMGERPAGSTDN